jgi:hypothetical protein
MVRCLSAMTKLKGEWQTRVVSVNPEMECVASRVLAVLAGCRSTHRSHIALILQGIPHSGYISPEAMVCCLSAFRLTRLEGLDSPWILNPLYLALTGKGDIRLRPSAQPSLLSLIFRFEGVSEHPEALVARIDAPLLNGLRVIFLHQTHFSTLHDLSSSSVAQRISRHTDEARVLFSNRYSMFGSHSHSVRDLMQTVRSAALRLLHRSVAHLSLKLSFRRCNSSIPTRVNIIFLKLRWQDSLPVTL